MDAGGGDGIRSHSSGYTEELDKQRKSPRWQRTRMGILSAHPMCSDCQQVLAEEVDHVIPAQIAVMQARESGRWPLDPWAGYYLRSNLQPLCRACHSRKTLADKTHVGPWPNVLEKYDATPRKKWSF